MEASIWLLEYDKEIKNYHSIVEEVKSLNCLTKRLVIMGARSTQVSFWSKWFLQWRSKPKSLFPFVYHELFKWRALSSNGGHLQFRPDIIDHLKNPIFLSLLSNNCFPLEKTCPTFNTKWLASDICL